MQNNTPQSIIIFDGLCNLCSSSVQFIIRHDVGNHFLFTNNQSNTAKKLLANTSLLLQPTIGTIILIENDQIFQKSTAVLRIAEKLRFPISLAYFFIIIPQSIRDFFYTLIAKNRYRWFGKKVACWVPTLALKKRFLD